MIHKMCVNQKLIPWRAILPSGRRNARKGVGILGGTLLSMLKVRASPMRKHVYNSSAHITKVVETVIGIHGGNAMDEVGIKLISTCIYK